MRKNAEVVRALRRHLDDQVTGCLHCSDGIDLYLMNGEVLAAHAPDDAEAILLRLVNSGAITSRMSEKMRHSVVDGAPLDEVVTGQVRDDLYLDLLAARFRHNLFAALFTGAAPEFEAMEAVFVWNLQVGHDSRSLIDEAEADAERVALLLGRGADLLLYPGPVPPQTQDEARLLDLCTPVISFQDLKRASPFEDGRTAVLVVGLLERQGLVTDDGSSFGVTDEDVATEELGAQNVQEDTLDVWLHGMIRERKGRRAGLPEETDWDASSDTVVEKNRLRGDVNEDQIATIVDLEEASEGGGLPPEHLARMDAEMGDSELDMFADHDLESGRGGGDGRFLGDQLDKVELTDAIPAAPEDTGANEVIEIGDADDYGVDESEAPVATLQMSFGGPELDEDTARRKLSVCNEVLCKVAEAMDEQNGVGSGQACIQLLVDGTPSEFAPLFHGVGVDARGSLSVDRALHNLGRRPPTEHRQLINRGVRDLIERALSSTYEELGDDVVDRVLASVAGYEKRLGL